jgi:dipeptidyl-peptidase-3
METAIALARLPLAAEFSVDPEASRKYYARARGLLVAFHEVLGHASGKTLVAHPSELLKEYDNTLEEARADLVALYHAFDPELAALDPDWEEVAKELYRSYATDALTQLRRVETGSELEEDHQRGTHLIVQTLLAKGAVAKVQREGRTFHEVTDYPKMRAAVGELLSTLMTFKAKGDYDGIRQLVLERGVRFDPALRDEVVARARKVDVPTVLLMTYPHLTPVVDSRGKVIDVRLDTDQGFLDQHLERTLLGAAPPKEAAALAARVGGSGEKLHAALRARARK